MKPDAATLDSMYTGQRMSTRAIADACGTSHMSVKRWLREYGIQPRPKGRGLANRGITAPSADDLHRMIHVEFLSYQAIADRFGVDPAAVGHWLIKAGVPTPEIWQSRRKRQREMPECETLNTMYKSASIEEIAAEFGVSYAAIDNSLRSCGISIRDAGWQNVGRPVCDDGHVVRSTYELRVDNWLNVHGIEHEYEPVLPFDRRCRADFLAAGKYIEIWGVNAHPVYNARKERKRVLYARHGLQLVEIPRHAFNTAHNGQWHRWLAREFLP